MVWFQVWEDSNQWDSLKNIMTVACKYAPAGSNGCSKLIGKWFVTIENETNLTDPNFESKKNLSFATVMHIFTGF
jgi:hypothetical protein